MTPKPGTLPIALSSSARLDLIEITAKAATLLPASKRLLVSLPSVSSTTVEGPALSAGDRASAISYLRVAADDAGVEWVVRRLPEGQPVHSALALIEAHDQLLEAASQLQLAAAALREAACRLDHSVRPIIVFAHELSARTELVSPGGQFRGRGPSR